MCSQLLAKCHYSSNFYRYPDSDVHVGACKFCLGMLQFGFNTSHQVYSVKQKMIENFHANRMSVHILLQSASFGIGCVVGCASAGAIAEHCGRKGGLQLSSTTFILGAIFTSLGHALNSVNLILIPAKWIIGFSGGLSAVLGPLYLIEIAPITVRGALGSVSYLSYSIGALLSQIMIHPVLRKNHNELSWPLLLVTLVPAVLQWLLLLFVCPESPRHLFITQGKLYDATSALQKLRCASNVEDDIEEMRIEQRAQQHVATFSICQLLSSKSLRTPLLISIMMQLSQQMSGINVIFQYAPPIFTSAGIKPELAASYSVIGLALTMVATIAIGTVALIDQTGRRSLQLYSLAGMSGLGILLTFFMLFEFLYYCSKMAAICTVLYVIFYAIGPGPIAGFITAELFSQAPRSTAMSVTVLVSWLANFILGMCFPIILSDNERWTFIFYSTILAAFWIFIYNKMPETKGQTFEQISAQFRKEDSIATL